MEEGKLRELEEERKEDVEGKEEVEREEDKGMDDTDEGKLDDEERLEEEEGKLEAGREEEVEPQGRVASSSHLLLFTSSCSFLLHSLPLLPSSLPPSSTLLLGGALALALRWLPPPPSLQ